MENSSNNERISINQIGIVVFLPLDWHRPGGRLVVEDIEYLPPIDEEVASFCDKSW